MDQKNTIVKCTANPNCLFNHNGICDNYVITIGADGSCQEYVETSSDEFQITETKRCHDDCIHFDDSDPFVGPICLFKHPEPLKNFYEGMPCDYYHKRGHRTKCNVYDDTMDIDDKHLGEAVTVKMKIAEFDKPNKNKSTIKDVMPECDLPICDWSCKHALRSGPSFNPDLWCDKMKGKPAVGLFCSEYEEEK